MIVVEYMDRLVPTMDKELTQNFKQILTKQGFKFMMKTKVVGGSGGPDGCKVEVEPSDGGAKTVIDCDIILISTGRKAYTEGL